MTSILTDDAIERPGGVAPWYGLTTSSMLISDLAADTLGHFSVNELKFRLDCIEFCLDLKELWVCGC